MLGPQLKNQCHTGQHPHLLSAPMCREELGSTPLRRDSDVTSLSHGPRVVKMGMPSPPPQGAPVSPALRSQPWPALVTFLSCWSLLWVCLSLDTSLHEGYPPGAQLPARYAASPMAETMGELRGRSKGSGLGSQASTCVSRRLSPDVSAVPVWGAGESAQASLLTEHCKLSPFTDRE